MPRYGRRAVSEIPKRLFLCDRSFRQPEEDATPIMQRSPCSSRRAQRTSGEDFHTSAGTSAENHFNTSSGIGTGVSVRRTVGIEASHDRN